MPENIKDFRSLFADGTGRISDEDAQAWLEPIGFDDWRKALQSIERLAANSETRRALFEVMPRLMLALTDAASPDRALINFEHFLSRLEQPLGLLQSAAREPRLLEMLVILFAGSQHLTDILLSSPEQFEVMQDRKQLARPKNRQQLYSEALRSVSGLTDYTSKLNALRKYQRLEILRIGASDLFGSLDLQTVTSQLSHLAISLVRVCLEMVAKMQNVSTVGFAVLALGKLGGRELNYSSDIDLLFLARSDDKRYQKLGQKLIDALSKVTAAGFLYRVDMRLRPWGRTGKLVPSIEENFTYLEDSAKLWEKQALYKARVIAGDEVLGIEFLQRARPIILALPPAALQAEVREMKKRIETQLQRRGNHWGEVKIGQGSIRDIEFVTQYLQLSQGRAYPEVHSRNTLDALARLVSAKILPPDDYGIISDGYVFLRFIEHHLQIMHYQQTHQLPLEPRELNYLAKRLGFSGSGAGVELAARYREHSRAIRGIFMKYLGKKSAGDSTPSGRGMAKPEPKGEEDREHVARMGASYAATFTGPEIVHHSRMAACLSENNLVEVNGIPLNKDLWQVTIVAYDYIGELSLICGLMYDFGIHILEGFIFTYEHAADMQIPSRKKARPVRRSGRRLRTREGNGARRKIVDVFTVRSVRDGIDAALWVRYALELSTLLRRLRNKEQREVQGELAKRISAVIQEFNVSNDTLLPVEIAIDNINSPDYTILRIDAPDTLGFLYELTNALTLNGIYVGRVVVNSLGNRVHDTLFVTDIQGKKITDAKRLWQLRVATVLVKHFTHLLPQSPNPESAMLHFRDFVSQLFEQSDWHSQLASLQRPEVLDALARLLGVSDFLWNDFLRMQYSNLLPIISNIDGLMHPSSKEDLRKVLALSLSEARDLEAQRRVLNAFKDREMFRIDMRYIQNIVSDFWHFSSELSDLAEVVVEKAVDLCYTDLVKKFGRPYLADGSRCKFSVCGLGKFGGRAIGFASDIELMFIYQGNGRTQGRSAIGNQEFFERLVNQTRKSIQAKREGIFEIDLRLRPYGRAGSLGVQFEVFKKYYSQTGPAWPYERQGLVKLRPVAGDEIFGEEVMSLRDACLYTNEPLDVAAMRAMRERQVSQLVMGGTVNAKFSPGGLVDLEYLVQGLQINYGTQNASLRIANTSDAMDALRDLDIFQIETYTKLREAHNFLRVLIEALRMVRGNAKDLTVPATDTKEFSFLARRLGYVDNEESLLVDLINHTSFVQESSRTLLG